MYSHLASHSKPPFSLGCKGSEVALYSLIKRAVQHVVSDCGLQLVLSISSSLSWCKYSLCCSSDQWNVWMFTGKPNLFWCPFNSSNSNNSMSPVDDCPASSGSFFHCHSQPHETFHKDPDWRQLIIFSDLFCSPIIAPLLFKPQVKVLVIPVFRSSNIVSLIALCSVNDGEDGGDEIDSVIN